MDKTVFVTAEPFGADSVISAGYCYFDGDGGTEYTSSASRDHRLIYVKRGRLKINRYGADSITVEAPSLVLLSPYSRDSLTCSSDCRDMWVSFIGFCDTLSELSIDSHDPIVLPSEEPCDVLSAYFEDVISELQLGERGFYTASRARLLSLLLIFARGGVGSTASTDSKREKIMPALSLMNREYSTTYSMEHYARICNMSKSSFLHSFSKIMQTTPIKYLNAIKLKNAIPLLLDTALPIGRVAQSLGFSSAQYFSNIFTAYYGISPREYRRGGKREI